jgi:putative heme-binding domain-containing protein
MKLCLVILLLSLATLATCPSLGSVPVPGLKVPAGFTVTEFAGPELANDIYCMTITLTGELLVSGRGYIKQLVDDSGDGRADRAILLADHPKNGAMGLLVEGAHLYVTGDGGLRRMPWRPGAFTETSELLVKLKTGGEHDAHAVSRGPDRALYLLCGNTSGADAKLSLLESSPIKKPIAGYVLRLTPDLKAGEIICDGFRNAYGFDWSSDGELFTYDSDNERCLGLPWYEGTRFYLIERGGHYGWRSPQLGEFWRLPPYYPDVVPPLADLGRGSPTGVVCYRHQQFPPEHRGAFFLLDWTFGVVHLARMRGEKAETSIFLRAEAGHGFAPTAAAVHPATGDLYLSTGGRGTRGAVYRVRHERGFLNLPPGARSLSPVASKQSKTLRGEPSSENRQASVLFKDFLAETRPDRQVNALRWLVKALGELGGKSSKQAFREGYAFVPKRPDELASLRLPLLAEARARFPSGNAILDRELSRLFALLNDDHPEALIKLLDRITTTSHPALDMHHLFVLACCPGPRTVATRQRIVQALLQLEAKYEERKLPREKHWALRLEEAFRALIDHDPLLPHAMLKHPLFGQPGHLVFTQDARVPVKEAATLLWQRVQADAEYPWSPQLVQLLTALPADTVLPLLRSKWGQSGLREAILPALAKRVWPEDRARFVEGLGFSKSETVRAALDALQQLPPATGVAKQDEVVALVLALRRWHQNDKKLTGLLNARLKQLTGHDANAGPHEWTAWAKGEYPATIPLLEGPDGVDRAKWDARLQGIDWKQGDATRGLAVFQQHCAACHQGTSAVGPDLAGVGKRFSHDDLLTTILQPNRDVPARYRSSVFVTHTGQVHVGLVIYDAVDGVIVQTGTSTTLRMAGAEIASRRETDRSLMPAGLLDALTDRQIADLLLYLKSDVNEPRTK